MRLVNDYVMDHMDNLSEDIASLEKVKNRLLEELRFKHLEFAARCEFRVGSVCTSGKCKCTECTSEKCKHMKRS